MLGRFFPHLCIFLRKKVACDLQVFFVPNFKEQYLVREVVCKICFNPSFIYFIIFFCADHCGQ